MSSYKHPFVVQTEQISLPASEYKEPELPTEIIDDSLFKPAAFGSEMKNANFLLADKIHFLSTFSVLPVFTRAPSSILIRTRNIATIQSLR
jgi:hypothetical protein